MWFNIYDRHCKERSGPSAQSTTRNHVNAKQTKPRTQTTTTTHTSQSLLLLSTCLVLITMSTCCFGVACGAPEPSFRDFVREQRQMDNLRGNLTLIEKRVDVTTVHKYIQNPRIPCRSGATCKRPNSSSFSCKCSKVSSFCWAATKFSPANCHYTRPSFGVHFVQP